MVSATEMKTFSEATLVGRIHKIIRQQTNEKNEGNTETNMKSIGFRKDITNVLQSVCFILFVLHYKMS